MNQPDKATIERSQRKSSEERITEIIDLAEQQILRTGSVAISINDISEACGASRSLIYSYFTDRDALVEAVLARNLNRLTVAGLEEAGRTGSIEERAVRCSDIYMHHVAAYGPVLHYVLREAATMPPLLIRMFRHLAASCQRDLMMGTREAFVLVEMMGAIPEELGRQIRKGDVAPEIASDVCERLIRNGITAITPR